MSCGMAAKRSDTGNLFEEIFEKIDAGLSVCDVSGKILKVNNFFSKLTGYSVRELYRKTFMDISYPEDLKTELDLLDQSIRQKKSSYKLEKRYIKKDKSLLWTELFVTIIRNKDGEPKQLLGSIRDISQRKQAEEKMTPDKKNAKSTSNANDAIITDKNADVINTDHSTADISYLKTIENELSESQELYTALLYSSPVGIAIHSEGKVLFVNEAGSRLLGAKSTREIVGRQISEIIHPDNLKNSLERISKLMSRTPGLYPTEDKFVRLDGTPIDVLVYANPVIYKGKKAVQVVISDVTLLKKLSNELKESEEKFSKAFMSSPESIILSTIDDGIYIDVNDSFLKLSGYTREEIIGKSSVDLSIWDNPEDRKNFLDEFARNGYVKDFESVYRTKNGMKGYVSISAEKIKIGNKDCLIAISSEISERKLASDRIKSSERTLKLFVKFAPAAIAMFDTEMRYIAVSQRFLSEYMIEGQDIIGRCHYDVFPEISQSWRDTHSRCLKGSSEKCDEDRFIRKDGTEGWMRWEVHPWYQLDNKIGGIVLFTEVITEKKLIEKSLRENEKRLSLIYKTVSDIIFQLDVEPGENYRFVSINNEFSKVTGLGEEHVLGKLVSEIITEPSLTMVLQKYREAIEEKRVVSWEETTIYPAGELIGLVSIAPVFDENGNCSTLIGSVHDITQLKRTQDEIIKAKERAEESDRLKTAFLNNMSHEIRTPLNAIMGFSNLLQDNFDNKNALREFTQIICKSVDDLLVIVDDILDIAKIESGQLSMRKEEFFLKDLFTELESHYQNYSRSISKTNIKFRLNLPDSENYRIYADYGKLKQILTNLLNNSYKFTDVGIIELGCKKNSPGSLTFQVSDTGIGIAKEKQALIYDRFYKVDSEATRLYGGTGLGLSIVKGILDFMGGDIRVDSKPGEGSIFAFTLPVKFVSAAVKAKVNTNQKKIIDTSGLTGISILVVEDDDPSTRYLKEALSEINCLKSFVKTGKEAIELAVKDHFNVILMDIRLPDITGYEATRKIKSVKPEIVIIAQTAYASASDREKAFEAGCNDYICKPFSREELYSKLRSFQKR